MKPFEESLNGAQPSAATCWRGVADTGPQYILPVLTLHRQETGEQLFLVGKGYVLQRLQPTTRLADCIKTGPHEFDMFLSSPAALEQNAHASHGLFLATKPIASLSAVTQKMS
ncbi:hypothetical protein AK812_SmicGene37313 [Symbiodinium microadriaticum]|uniref:Uncharacterized protein n=1 Tax=Symbiodinium microadriaticum TaxID=2951 RepID=A0A1Q9CGT8_SYMMI|nr:hypothetical protein AK812_SmicGene37313 [Symbiodinium microadriaticum]